MATPVFLLPDTGAYSGGDPCAARSVQALLKVPTIIAIDDRDVPLLQYPVAGGPD